MKEKWDLLQFRFCVILCMLSFIGHLPGCSSNTDPKVVSKDNSIVRKNEKSGVSMLVEVSPSRPKLSDLVSMTITISYPEAVQVEQPEFGQSVGDFIVRDYKLKLLSSQSSESNSPRSEISIQYQLEPMFSGRNLIRAIPVAFSTKPRAKDLDGSTRDATRDDATRDFVQSEPIEIFVESEFGDQSPDLSLVSPMIEPMDRPASSLKWLWAFVVGVSLLFALGYWWFRKTRRGNLVEVEATPEELAEIALSQLISEQLPSKGLVKEFYLRLTGIVRSYIESKTGLRAPEQTTEEFLRDVRSSRYFDLARSSQLHEFLTAADLVKYAGQQPNQSNIEESVQRAREFIALQFATTGEKDDLSEVSAGGRSSTGNQHGFDQFSQVEN